MKNLFFIFSLLLFSLPSLAGVTSDTLWTHARHEMQRGNYEEAYRAYQQLSSLQDTTYKQIYFKDIEDLHDRYQFNDLKLENEQRESRQKRDLIKFLFFFIGVSAITATLLYFSNKRLNRIRKKLNEERKMAEASIRGKSLFLSTMSHEIRTPLNALAGFSEVLSMDGIDDETVKISNDAIQMNSELLLKLIRDVADMSMVDMEHMNFISTPVMPFLFVSVWQKRWRNKAYFCADTI
jgi:signal transduction histidine kinase